MFERAINDEFARDKSLTPQQRYQRRRRAAGLCALCGGLAVNGGSRCRKHLNRIKRKGRPVRTDD